MMKQIEAIQSSKDGKYYALIYGTQYEVILVSIPTDEPKKEVSKEVKGGKKGGKSVKS